MYPVTMPTLLSQFRFNGPLNHKKGVLRFITDAVDGEVPMPIWTADDVREMCVKRVQAVNDQMVEWAAAGEPYERKWIKMDWDPLVKYLEGYDEWQHLARLLTDRYWGHLD